MTLDTWGLLMKHDMYISTQTLYYSGGWGELVMVAMHFMKIPSSSV